MVKLHAWLGVTISQHAQVVHVAIPFAENGLSHPSTEQIFSDDIIATPSVDVVSLLV